MMTRRWKSMLVCASLVVAGGSRAAWGQFDLNLTVEPEEAGFIATGTTTDGDTTVSATAADGFVFVGWEGDIETDESSFSFPLTADTTLTAIFEEAPPGEFALSAFANISGAGTLVREPAEFAYEDGAEVTITAYAGEGYVFTGWVGDVPEDADATGESLNLVMTKDIELEAQFAAAQELDDGQTGMCGAMGTVSMGLMLSMMLMMKVSRSRW